MNPNELAYMSVAEMSRKIKNRELSPVEIVESFIKRIEERNKSLNAFVYYGFDYAREKAKQAEQDILSGKELGPLHGVPTAMKDLFHHPGWINTSGGIRSLKNHVSTNYNLYTQRVEKAGAILLGKTNSPIMGFRGTTDNYLFGPTRNPFDLSKNSGGSSGGGAAAVADGLVPIAEGTDGGGSIRIPAAWCGLYGYKSSFGRVPFITRPNAFGAIAPFLYEGTMTRSVEDAAIGLNVLAGYDARDPFSLDEKTDFTASLKRSIKGMKIAYSSDFDVYPVEPEIKDIVSKAVRKFEELGATVEEVKFGIKRHHMELAELWCRLITISTIEAFEGFKKQGINLMKNHREDLPPELIYWYEKCDGMTLHDLIRDQQIRTEIYDAIQNVFENYDLIVTPTLACMPVDNANDGNTVGPTQINGEEVEPLIGWCMTYFTNYSGHPSASIPAGLSKNNLPVGMQIIGKRYADHDVLAASAAFERIKPWKDDYKLVENRQL
ncbi:amidase [Paenibacillus sp. BSR1-1]|uniref:amidase n=1 Tax=Paenibacillus sp. BSR1-1 TaxID=3020845 RepID=UPI0025AF75AE|nr:amidase [Paenibacillus sp. BSR1-1]MDN3019418.1 amidase [Paenibacillus sp. BSR1-1]